MLGVSAGYLGLPVMILGYAIVLAGRLPEVARGLALGAGLLLVSLCLRGLDMAWCADWPRGTHFGWHLLNAVMLAWMIEVWRRWKMSRG